MMKSGIYLFVSLAVTGVFCHMPTVYEFCSHVVANGDGRRATCDASQCQGRPGKIGPVGPRGIPGFKGDKGELGRSKELEEKVDFLTDSVDRLKSVLGGHEPTRENLCFMGMKNGGIPDSALSASSSWDGNHVPRLGRLNFKGSSGVAGAWCARQNRVGEWYQVDFGTSVSVAGLITQGRYNSNQWVTSFSVQCGDTIGNLETVRENGVEKIFSGNRDANTKVVNLFPRPITCRFIKIYPKTWNNHISMRMEFISGDCVDFY